MNETSRMEEYVAELEAKLVGYDAFQEAATQANDGDPIWEFYDAKLWRSLLSWKRRALAYEEDLRRIDRILTTVSGNNLPAGEAPKMHVRNIARTALERQ